MQVMQNRCYLTFSTVGHSIKIFTAYSFQEVSFHIVMEKMVELAMFPARQANLIEGGGEWAVDILRLQIHSFFNFFNKISHNIESN